MCFFSVLPGKRLRLVERMVRSERDLVLMLTRLRKHKNSPCLLFSLWYISILMSSLKGIVMSATDDNMSMTDLN